MSSNSSAPPHCCSAASPELKLYQAFIFSVPIFFTFVLLLLFYFFYLRRRQADWLSLRMRTLHQDGAPPQSGLKREMREMLPIVIFGESFLIRETECSICLGDYKANDQLQQIPGCGHTFHMGCVDHWLMNNATCPLCRVSLLPASKTSEPVAIHDDPSDARELGGELMERIRNADSSQDQEVERREERENCGGSSGVVFCDARREVGLCVLNGEASVVIDIDDHRALSSSQEEAAVS